MRVYLGGDSGPWRQQVADALSARHVAVDVDTDRWPLERRQQAIRNSDVVVVKLDEQLDGAVEAHYAFSWWRPVIAIASKPVSGWLAHCLQAQVHSPDQAVELVIDRFLHRYDPMALLRPSR